MNKIAIVTGGGSGIGEAISVKLADSGIMVIVIDVSDEKAVKVVSNITKKGNKAYYYNCNIADQSEVREILKNIVDKHGQPDILINNAGVAHIGNAENTSESDFDRVINVNVKGAYNMIHETLPYMKSKGGSIVNMVSVAATVAVPNRFAYSTSKGAMLAMTLSVAKDFIEYNIRCNSVSPARIHTPFVDGYIAEHFPGKEKEKFEELSRTQPIGRMGSPDDVASFVLYLCSEEASFLTGCDYPIDGGFVKLNT